MNRLILLISLFSVSLFATSINIAVAANVSYAIDDIKEAFLKTNPSSKINITLGSSGKLSAKIINGAPYDIFMSANMLYPNTLYEKKLTSYAPKIYAKGSLVVLSTKDFDKRMGIDILKQENIKTIAIGNPKTAPYGKASLEVLKNSSLYNDVKSKLIYAESISQAVSYTLKATDIGFIAKSSIYSKNMSKYKDKLTWIDIDKNLYTPINQGIVKLNKKELTNKFYEFIFSQKVQDIFKKYGYQINE